MSRSPDPRRPAAPRRGPLLAGAAAVLLAGAAGAWFWQTSATPGPGPAPTSAPAAAEAVSGGSTVAPALPAPSATAGATPAAPGQTGAAPRAATLVATAAEAARQLDRLGALPPGDDAIALGRQLAEGATPGSAPAFRDALLQTRNPAIERVAIAALARTADSAIVQDLARAYGQLPQEQRGRVLQVLEGAGNPAALQGLAAIVEADTSEKHSPLTMSALYGMASLGTVDSVDYLLRQTTTQDTVDLALMALERVRTRQAVAQIRAAAAGSKGLETLSPSMRGNLVRIAGVAEAQLTP